MSAASRPEVGSILNFRATGRMRMGHVAVVSNVVDSRTIEIDQANWGGRRAASATTSPSSTSRPANDWTAGPGRARPHRRLRQRLPDLRLHLRPPRQRHDGRQRRRRPRPPRPPSPSPPRRRPKRSPRPPTTTAAAPRASYRRHFARHARFFGQRHRLPRARPGRVRSGTRPPPPPHLASRQRLALASFLALGTRSEADVRARPGLPCRPRPAAAASTDLAAAWRHSAGRRSTASTGRSTISTRSPPATSTPRCASSDPARRRQPYVRRSRRALQPGRQFPPPHGVRRGDRILMLLGNVQPLWEVMLAAMKLGAVVIPATTMLTEDDLRDRLARGRVRHVIAAGELAPALRPARRRLHPHRRRRRAGLASTIAESAGASATVRARRARRGPPTRCCCISPPAPPRSRSSCCTAIRAIRSAIFRTMYWIGLQPGDVHLNISSPGWAKHAWSSVFAPWNAGRHHRDPQPAPLRRQAPAAHAGRMRASPRSARRRRSGACWCRRIWPRPRCICARRSLPASRSTPR